MIRGLVVPSGTAVQRRHSGVDVQVILNCSGSVHGRYVRKQMSRPSKKSELVPVRELTVGKIYYVSGRDVDVL